MEAPCSRFTPAEGGARLATAASASNTLAAEYASFISTRMIYEDAYKIRGLFSEGRQRSVYVTRASRVDVVAYELNILTDLKITKAVTYNDDFDWATELELQEVLVCTSPVLKRILEEKTLAMPNINVLVLDSSHLVCRDDNLKYIMALYKKCKEEIRPRILALTYPLFSSPRKEDANSIKNEEQLKVDDDGDSEKLEESCETLAKIVNEILPQDSSENLPKPEEKEILPKDSNEILPQSEKCGILSNSEAGDILPNAEALEILPKLDNSKIVPETEGCDISPATKVTEILPKAKEKLPKMEETTTTDSKNDPEGEENSVQKFKKKEEDIEQIGVYENLDDFEMYEKLEWKIEELEKELCCQMDLAEDIDGGKRLSATITKPRELIIEYSSQPSSDRLPEDYVDLEQFMRKTVGDSMDFLDEHRYDPTEIYGEDLYEEFMSIPDPTIEPKFIFRQFLYILEQLGPYAADKAAFSLLTKLEKLKIKVPYERHFLLLCLCTSVFVKIRCYADLIFSKYESDWDKIQTFCTPKVLRFAEILEKFCPPEFAKEIPKKSANSQNSTQNEDEPKDTENIEDNKTSDVVKNDENQIQHSSFKAKELLEAIEKCDFISLSNKIEDKVHIYEANLKDIDDISIKTSEIVLDKSKKETKIVEAEQKLDNSSPKELNSTENNSNNGQNELNSAENNSNNNQNELNSTENNSNNNQNELNSTENNSSNNQNELNNMDNKHNNCQNGSSSLADVKNVLGFSRRTGRTRGRGRTQRSNQARTQQLLQNPDALCGVVFMKEPLMAKILFMLIVDMSRANPKLSYLCAQYCAVERPADPGTEPRECQRQGKKQEDVLKKFRMHECNLLLATSALEEGIDLPRCNLVVRWDIPASYRSYGLCRSRGRATRAACAVLTCGADQHTQTLLHNVSVYTELDQIISRKCGCGIQDEPPQSEEDHADSFTHLVKPYTPNEAKNKTCSENSDNKNNTTTKTEVENKNSEDFNSDTTIGSDNNKIIDNNNLICNKCNNKRNSVDTECPCVSLKNKNISFDNKDVKKVNRKGDEFTASVDLSSAIALINRYCGKLPSDTFTRLAPQWWLEEVHLPVKNSNETRKAYICTLRLPLNCPVKYNIVGHPMPTRVLARRMAALQACRVLHQSGELDQQLLPVGKENFKAAELDAELEAGDHRPGTTKRRQYYFKRTAWAFTDCQPVVDTSDSEIDPQKDGVKCEDKTHEKPTPGTKRNMLYAIVSKLWCALPERYNTRGRRLHAPQNASQAIGILMAREEPDSLQIPSFPVYTRSGEVRVSVEYVPDADVRVSPRRGRLVRRFMRFVFAEVLRVRRRGMKLQSEGSTHNNYYIVPTIKTTREDGSSKIDIDWAFLELIYQHTEEKKHSEIERPSLWQHDEEEQEMMLQGEKTEKKPSEEVKKMESPLLASGETFMFDADRYREAVVTPWYRNQDLPQFFLVAEICWSLSPDSAFPSATHASFRQYYSVKYGVTLTQPNQPLLDVDHTSNRLNLLTPRYVNRKGVALPVSSERTRRAKRDRLDQKQILVPELCRVHPFAAPLWFATVALPCVLYRINALLIADEIRRSVAIDVGLGIPKIDEKTWPGFQWPPLDFGWSLAEVLSADSEKNERKREEDWSREEKENKAIEEKEQKEKEEHALEEAREKTINEILQEKEAAESGFEIGTWSNDMASSLPPETEYDEYMEPLPSNLTFCTSASGGANWCDPIEKPRSQFQPTRRYSMADSDCSYMSSDFDTDDSDFDSEDSGDDETDISGFCSSKNSNAAMGVRIEYKTAHEAEAVDLEKKKKVNPAPQPDEEDDAADRKMHEEFVKAGEAPIEYIEKFRQFVAKHKQNIIENGLLIKQDEPLVDILPEPTKESHEKLTRNQLAVKKINDITTTIEGIENYEDLKIGDQEKITRDNLSHENLKANEIVEKEILDNQIPDSKNIREHENLTRTDLELEEISNKLSKVDVSSTTPLLNEIFPYGNTELNLLDDNGQINLESIEKNKRILLAQLKSNLSQEDIKKLNCFSMKDVDIDAPDYVNEKVVNVGFDSKENYTEKVNKWRQPDEFKPYYLDGKGYGKEFDFDYQPDLEGHPGPSPSVILQALTMSNANDGINLERLETIGDSFLKFAITAYLYCAHPTVHEGKLSHMRSKQVSNLNLYRLGRNKRLGARMIASKFEPHDNWLPPCHKPPSTLHPRMTDKDESPPNSEATPLDNNGCFIPYNLITQHSIPDKSIADCVEALIGAYLLECGPRGALLFMSWLGIRVLPRHELPLSHDHPYVVDHDNFCREPKPQPPTPPRKSDVTDSEPDSSDEEESSWQEQQEQAPERDCSWRGRPLGSLAPHRDAEGNWYQTIFGELKAPPSPLLRYIEDPEGELERMLSGYDALERTLQYRFKDRSLLLQALTHASHQQNRLTDCYQRLEFLGDAILDYLITRHLYEDPRRHSPGALTDLRSALVNNTIFATLAARHGFHKHFRHTAPGLADVLAQYVTVQHENGHSISEEHYLIQEDEMEQAEDVEVPKALGDLFESVAGAIFLDSGMSLGAVWKSYVNLMGAELEAFSAAAPKSPVRELLEAEPDTAKFGKPERLADGRRVRVCVEVFGRGAFKGVGRNYRIAKGTAARCALRHLKIHRQR